MITPIEMYTMVPKSQEASMQHHAENTKQVNQQLNGMQQIENQARQNTQQTVRAANADNPEYRYDAKEHGNNEYYGGQREKKKKKDEEKKEEGTVKKTSPGRFDVRI